MNMIKHSIGILLNKLTDRKGTTLVEYGFILLLIAIVIVLMITGLGKSTNNMYSSINQKVKSASD
ncbi:MAG TPA: Flp family type IVb pilin [Geobacteraceae bacterium]